MNNFCIWDEIRDNPDYRVYAREDGVWRQGNIQINTMLCVHSSHFLVLDPNILIHPDWDVYVELERRRQHEGEAEPWRGLEFHLGRKWHPVIGGQIPWTDGWRYRWASEQSEEQLVEIDEDGNVEPVNDSEPEGEGVSGDYVTTPDPKDCDFTGNLEIVVDFADDPHAENKKLYADLEAEFPGVDVWRYWEYDNGSGWEIKLCSPVWFRGHQYRPLPHIRHRIQWDLDVAEFGDEAYKLWQYGDEPDRWRPMRFGGDGVSWLHGYYNRLNPEEVFKPKALRVHVYENANSGEVKLYLVGEGGMLDSFHDGEGKAWHKKIIDGKDEFELKGV